jgi:hypothetical protein
MKPSYIGIAGSQSPLFPCRNIMATKDNFVKFCGHAVSNITTTCFLSNIVGVFK